MTDKEFLERVDIPKVIDFLEKLIAQIREQDRQVEKRAAVGAGQIK